MLELNKNILLIYYWTFELQQTLDLKKKKADVGDIVQGTSLALPYDNNPRSHFILFFVKFFYYVKVSILNLHSKKNSLPPCICSFFRGCLWLQRR
jgi:hypothetical protein